MPGPTADTARRAIEPGSVPYGERQELEAGLQSLLGGGAEQAPGAAPVGNISPQDPFGDPMSALMGKEGYQSNLPVTAGLSVGPGPGPDVQTNLPVSTMETLQEMALHAKTPRVRQLALLALRRIVRESRRGPA